ncbi:MAG: YebC/PmpR family DNA-binding transcriptional regulator [Leptospirillia bacterium]
MAGHSKWANTKHRKAAVDAKRGKVFTRLGKEITVAARMGGGDVDANPRLRTAVNKARADNMPMDNIKRAIQRGTGEIPGVVYEEIVYEGYGPGGVALYMEVTTDNRNRTVGEIRHALSKNGGNMGENGCVAWMFHKKGIITVEAEGVSEDALMDAALSAGAEDMELQDDVYQITTEPGDCETVVEALRAAGFTPQDDEIRMVPDNEVKLEGKDAERMIRLMEVLEDHDDIQSVSANFDIPDEILERLLG